MWLINLLFGFFLAFNGRRSVWALVGITGFLSGLWLSSVIWNNNSAALTWLDIVIAIITGLVGAALTQFFGRFMIAAAGFIAGGYGVIAIISSSGWLNMDSPWIPFLVGGIIGIVLIGILFDWAIIGLTAWIGAALVISGLNLEGTLAWVIFGVVFLAGSFSQLRGYSTTKHVERKRKEEND